MSRPERRQHRRLDIRLPLECSSAESSGRPATFRTVTFNISTGGVYFETEASDIKPGMRLNLELTVPPGDGHFPYQGHVTGTAEVLRVEPLPPKTDAAGKTRSWSGVATRFDERLKLSF